MGRLPAGLLLFALALGGCARPPDPGVKVVVPELPTTLDWSRSDARSWANYPVMLATQRGLTRLLPDGSVGPALARSWERARLADGRERYTFHLREDVRWSDGVTPLVAEDFVVGWRRALEGEERGELADLDGAAEVLALEAQGAPREALDAALARVGVKALAPHTLEVTLARARGYFLARLANVYLFFPAPGRALAGRSPEAVRDYFDRPRDGHPLALGPWRVEAWDRAGERVRLVRNPHTAFPPALGAGEAWPEAVTLLRSEVGPALFARGRVGFVFADSALALRGPEAAALGREPLLSTYFLAFNTARPPLDRAEVRLALARALDREALLAGLLPQARVTRTLLPRALPLAAPPGDEARLPAYAPEEARAALARAGGVGRPLRLLLRAGDSFVPEVAIAERLAAQLGRVGVTVEVDARGDFGTELARRGPDGERAWDLYLRRLGADYAHPNTFFTLFEREGNHQTGWERLGGGEPMRRFEALLAEGDAEPDAPRARRAYTRAQEVLLAEQVVLVPLYHPDRYFQAQPWVRGLAVDLFNFLSLAELRTAPAEGAP